MSNDLHVQEAKIDQIIANLKSGAWQVPQFQRDFVWNEAQVIGLIDSILRSRPIGMVTLWAQADEAELPLEPVSIPDWDAENKRTAPKYFAPKDRKPNSYYAILDGRQRCTSIAMAFGGLHPVNGSYKFAGEFFLNVAEKEPTKRILFKKRREIVEENLSTPSVCIGKGLFPLALDPNVDGLFAQWLNYTEAVSDPKNYPGNELPNAEELANRKTVLREAFNGINSTKMAVYVVPSSYRLDEICEIFETLNTTGTKVSTVDLIHSTLYAETQAAGGGGIDLRDWIDDLGQHDGATGWASRNKRPELIAQMVTACYVALDEKPEPRKRSGSPVKGSASISSVKSADLLATPATHWRNVIQNEERLAEFLGDFQKCVAEGYFPMEACPYPISSSIYVGLRWRKAFEPQACRWSIDDLDALYRAFFWRNALTNRYDQGFLTQLGTDLKSLRGILDERENYPSAMSWVDFAQGKLTDLMETKGPSNEDLKALALKGRLSGALQKALQLPFIGRATKDILSAQTIISFPESDNFEMHHIYPRAWCASNKSGDLKDVLDPQVAEYDYKESIANLTPLSRVSNNKWKAKVPGQAILDAGLKFDHLSKTLERYFIDKESFEILVARQPDPLSFWDHRATLIANYFERNLVITL
ncbi:DUF262 domain-containing protein [Alcanivorax sp.]|uniref:DUF262 domain-containing protein n=1 Tax=Alcanivorax sp. TaxID=1872427 RepID=UPI0025C07F19|nr:DUF262 domain-containing protein [Alcanivorax sp.]